MCVWKKRGFGPFEHMGEGLGAFRDKNPTDYQVKRAEVGNLRYCPCLTPFEAGVYLGLQCLVSAGDDVATYLPGTAFQVWFSGGTHF